MAGRDLQPLERVATPEQLLSARSEVMAVYMDEKIEDYIVDIVHATREPGDYGLRDVTPLIQYGASPRASIYLALCSRAHAFLQGRGYVLPEDVKSIGPDVLRHRIITSFEAEAEEVTSDDLVARIFAAVEVP
jgi:MoxR-like ATPase